MAKANATAINLIIGFLHVIPSRGKTPSRYARLDVSALRARREGKTGA